MSKKVQVEVEKCLKEVKLHIESYDEKFDELKVFNRQHISFDRSKEEAKKEQLRGKKHAIRTTTLELMDYKHVMDSKGRIENDLENLLRKLHRVGQHVKDWIGQGDVRDKDSLEFWKKQVEVRYKRGKVFYKLGEASEAEKDDYGDSQDATRWIREFIAVLTEQSEQFGAEVESCKRETGEQASRDRATQLEAFMELHQSHIMHLDELVRRVRNGDISIESDGDFLRELEEELSPYVRENQSLDIVVTCDELYAELGLENESENVDPRGSNQNAGVVCCDSSSSPKEFSSSSLSGKNDKTDDIAMIQQQQQQNTGVGSPVSPPQPPPSQGKRQQHSNSSNNFATPPPIYDPQHRTIGSVSQQQLTGNAPWATFPMQTSGGKCVITAGGEANREDPGTSTSTTGGPSPLSPGGSSAPSTGDNQCLLSVASSLASSPPTVSGNRTVCSWAQAAGARRGAAMAEEKNLTAMNSIATTVQLSTEECLDYNTRGLKFWDKITHESLEIITEEFLSHEASQLSVRVGQLVFVEERHSSGWSFGQLLDTTNSCYAANSSNNISGKNSSFTATSISGWFPSFCGRGDVTLVQVEEDLWTAISPHYPKNSSLTVHSSDLARLCVMEWPPSTGRSAPSSTSSQPQQIPESSSSGGGSMHSSYTSVKQHHQTTQQRRLSYSSGSATSTVHANAPLIGLHSTVIENGYDWNGGKATNVRIYAQQEDVELAPGLITGTRPILASALRLPRAHDAQWDWHGELGDDSAQHLHFQKGEKIEVIVKHVSGWTHGRILDNQKRVGWFPDFTLHPADPKLLLRSEAATRQETL